MNRKLYLPLILLTAAVLSSCATVRTEPEGVPQSVHNFLNDNGEDFQHYEVSDISEPELFKRHSMSYFVYEDPERVWTDYINTDPAAAFDSRIIDFGVVYNPDDTTLYKNGDPRLPSFSEGQIYLLDLTLLGFYSLPATFKVSRIDAEDKMIEFIYLKNNVSNGFQRIYLKSGFDPEGVPVTEIEHISFFKSDHPFRDKYLYPPFHKQTVRDFHENIFRINKLEWSLP